MHKNGNMIHRKTQTIIKSIHIATLWYATQQWYLVHGVHQPHYTQPTGVIFRAM